MRWFTAGALLGVLTIPSCKLITISVAEESTITVEQGTIVEALVDNLGYGEFIDMDLTEAESLRNQGVEPGDIQDVRLRYLQLEAVSPQGADLSFLNSMEVWVEAPDVPQALLASADAFPAGQALVDFEVEDLDLTPYVVSQRMTFSTVVNGSRPEQDTDVTARFEVAVGVTTQGACGAAAGGE